MGFWFYLMGFNITLDPGRSVPHSFCHKTKEYLCLEILCSKLKLLPLIPDSELQIFMQISFWAS